MAISEASEAESNSNASALSDTEVKVTLPRTGAGSRGRYGPRKKRGAPTRVSSRQVKPRIATPKVKTATKTKSSSTKTTIGGYDTDSANSSKQVLNDSDIASDMAEITPTRRKSTRRHTASKKKLKDESEEE